MHPEEFYISIKLIISSVFHKKDLYQKILYKLIKLLYTVIKEKEVYKDN